MALTSMARPCNFSSAVKNKLYGKRNVRTGGDISLAACSHAGYFYSVS